MRYSWENQNKIKALQEFLGYCLKADTSQAKALINIGEGANGKSLIFETIRKIMGGSKNCASVPMDCFSNRNYLAQLFGKLVNISIESEAKGVVNDANFKAIVTGDTIMVDQKYKHTPLNLIHSQG